MALALQVTKEMEEIAQTSMVAKTRLASKEWNALMCLLLAQALFVELVQVAPLETV